MPEFETLSSERIEFKNGDEFLDLSINVARDGTRETKYLRLARGYFAANGDPRFRKGGVTLPADREALDKLAEALKKLDLSAFAGGATDGPE